MTDTDQIIRSYTPEQTAAMRDDMITLTVIPVVQNYFNKYAEVKSVILCVSQYWNDEADDAVHGELLISVQENPDIESWRKRSIAEFHDDNDNWEDDDKWDYEFLLEGKAQIKGTSLEKFDYEWLSGWDSNYEAIAPFAAFCPEDAHQEMCLAESSQAYAIFRRGENGVETEIVGELLRPWVDGVKCDWARYQEEEAQAAQQIQPETNNETPKAADSSARVKKGFWARLFGKK